MTNKNVFLIFGILSLVSILAYLFFWMLTTPYDLFPLDPVLRLRMQQAMINIITRRTNHVLAMVVSATLIASTSLVFQTLTNNRILTPSLIGFDAIFITIQTAIVFFLTSRSLFYVNPYLNFGLSAGLMIGITMLMYKAILRKNKNNMVFLLLIGMVLSTLSRSLASFLQNIMDPMEFQSVVIRTEVSVSNMNTSIIYLSIPLLIIIFGLILRDVKTYDVMALGEANAIGLGVEYTKKMNLALIYIAVAMSISTAMIGPLSFLGLIAVNASREILKTYKHAQLLVLSSLIAMTFVISGQTVIIETGYRTTVSVWISLIGGAYMIYLLIKERPS